LNNSEAGTRHVFHVDLLKRHDPITFQEVSKSPQRRRRVRLIKQHKAAYDGVKPSRGVESVQLHRLKSDVAGEHADVPEMREYIRRQPARAPSSSINCGSPRYSTRCRARGGSARNIVTLTINNRLPPLLRVLANATQDYAISGKCALQLWISG
jgi:hypothetical protein